MKNAVRLLLVGLVVGCAKKPDDHEGAWWLVDDIPGASSGGGEGEGEEDDFDDEGGGPSMWGELEVDGDQVIGGVVGFFAEGACDIDQEVVSVSTPSESCSGCTITAALEVAATEPFEGDASSCAAVGWPFVDGGTLTIGVAGTTVYVLQDGEWLDVAEGEVEEGALWFVSVDAGGVDDEED